MTSEPPIFKLVMSIEPDCELPFSCGNVSKTAAVRRKSTASFIENARAEVPSCARTTVRVLPLLPVTFTISLFVPSSNVTKNDSPLLKVGKTEPSVTPILVADEFIFPDRDVVALFLKTIANLNLLYLTKQLPSR